MIRLEGPYRQSQINDYLSCPQALLLRLEGVEPLFRPLGLSRGAAVRRAKDISGIPISAYARKSPEDRKELLAEVEGLLLRIQHSPDVGAGLKKWAKPIKDFDAKVSTSAKELDKLEKDLRWKFPPAKKIQLSTIQETNLTNAVKRVDDLPAKPILDTDGEQISFSTVFREQMGTLTGLADVAKKQTRERTKLYDDFVNEIKEELEEVGIENVSEAKADTRINQLEEWIGYTANNQLKKCDLKKYKGSYVAHKETLKNRRIWTTTLGDISKKAENKGLSRATLDILKKDFAETERVAKKRSSDELTALIARVRRELSVATDRLDMKERTDQQDAQKESLIREIIEGIAKVDFANEEGSEKAIKQLNDKIERLKGLDESDVADDLSAILKRLRPAEDYGSNG